VLVGSCNGVFHAIDKETGKARWTYEAIRDARPGGRAEFHGSPLVAGDLLLTATDDRDPGGFGHVYALERSTGRLRWKHQAARGVMSDILRSCPSVYAFTLGDELLCLDLETGRVNWSQRLGPAADTAATFVTTPALDGNRLYVGSQGGDVSALGARTGRVEWSTNVGARVVAPIVLRDDSLYVPTGASRLVRLAPRDGSKEGEIALAGSVFGAPLPIANGLALFTTGPIPESNEWAQVLTMVDGALDGVRWTQHAPRGWSSSRPYLWRGGVLVGGEKGEIAAFRPTDGSVLWSDSLEGTIRGIGSDDDRLYVGTLRGSVYAYEPPEGKTSP
jgi:eukaryotic-like serine/threonine-protein kinase